MNKKGQEEIVGFVVVVVLVAIVFVIILGFSLNKKPNVLEKESLEIKQFLESIRQITSECSLKGDIPGNFKEIITACFDGLSCSSGQKACDELNETATGIMKKSYVVGQDAYVKGYVLSIYFEEDISEEKEEILIKKRGACSETNYREADDFFPYLNGQIFVNLRLCY